MLIPRLALVFRMQGSTLIISAGNIKVVKKKNNSIYLSVFIIGVIIESILAFIHELGVQFRGPAYPIIISEL